MADTFWTEPEGTVGVIDPDGAPVLLPKADALARMAEGWQPMERLAQRKLANEQARSEALRQRFDQPGSAALAGVLRGATLGLSDVAIRALGGEEATEAARLEREYNPKASFGGELAGAAGSMLLPVGPVAAATRLGAGVKAGVEGALGGGKLAGIASTTARGLVEGAAFGLGGGVSEIALTNKGQYSPADAASIIARHMGAGAAFGGGLGLIGGSTAAAVRAVSGKLGLGRASKALKDLEGVNKGLEGLEGQYASETERLLANAQPLATEVRQGLQQSIKPLQRQAALEADARVPGKALEYEQAQKVVARSEKSADLARAAQSAEAEYRLASEGAEVQKKLTLASAREREGYGRISELAEKRDALVGEYREGASKLYGEGATVPDVLARRQALLEHFGVDPASVAGKGPDYPLNKLAELAKLAPIDRAKGATRHGYVVLYELERAAGIGPGGRGYGEIGRELANIEHSILGVASASHKTRGALPRGAQALPDEGIESIIARSRTALSEADDRISTSLMESEGARQRWQQAQQQLKDSTVSEAQLLRARKTIAEVEAASGAGQRLSDAQKRLAEDDALRVQLKFFKRAPGEPIFHQGMHGPSVAEQLEKLPPDLKAKLAEEQRLLAAKEALAEQLGGKNSGLAGKLLGRAAGTGAARAVRRGTGSTASSFGTGSGSLLGGAAAATASSLVSSKIGALINSGLSLGKAGTHVGAAAGAVLGKAYSAAKRIARLGSPSAIKFGSEEMFNLKQRLDAFRTPEEFETHLRASLAATVPADLGDKLVKQEVRKWAFLSSKMPRSPQQEAADRGELPIPTQKKWKPTPTQVAQYARYLQGAVDPMSVPHLFAKGRLTPEAVEAARAVYPEAFAGFQAAVEAQVREDYAKGKLYSPRVERNVRVLMQAPQEPPNLVLQSFFQPKGRSMPSKGFGKAVSLAKQLMPLGDTIQQR